MIQDSKDFKIAVSSNLIIFVGNFGSGKTEVAVNYVQYLAKNSKDKVKIVDLDIVNPYFRSREARRILEAQGIEVIAPNDEKFYAESPIISPVIKSEISSGSSNLILDVGGDDMGARVLSSINDAFAGRGYEFLMVLNINRPFTSDVEGCLKIMNEIETASRLKVTGLVSNAHLIDDTTEEVIRKGYELVLGVSKKTGIPVKFITVDTSLLSHIDRSKYSCPILPIERLMLKPWETRETIPGSGRGL